MSVYLNIIKKLNGNLNEGYIVKFLEKPTKAAFSTVINAGLYIIEPDVMDYVLMEKNTTLASNYFLTYWSPEYHYMQSN